MINKQNIFSSSIMPHILKIYRVKDSGNDRRGFYRMKTSLFLTLEDGSAWQGWGELEKPVEGEVVFTTAMSGYPQTLTDPSYCGQIVVFAFPPIGVYGVDKDSLESRRVWHQAAVINSLDEENNGRFEKLSSWIKESGTPLIEGIDTRSLILKIREVGSMMGRLDFIEKTPLMTDLPPDMVTAVSCKKIEVVGEGELTIAVLDYGIKEGIMRGLAARGCRLIRFPNTTHAGEILGAGVDAIFLSNGPGNPAVLDAETTTVRQLLGKKPLLGVCLGNQLLARACGASTHKLPFGHRGANQPVVETATGRGLLTSQNHQYAVAEESLPGTGLEVCYRHLGDGTVEGLLHKEFSAMSVQFHPEASPGPDDASYIFDDFITKIRAAKGV